MTSFAQQLRSRLFGGVLGGSSKATAAAGVDLSRKTKKNSSTAHLDTEKNPYSFGTVQYPDDLAKLQEKMYMVFNRNIKLQRNIKSKMVLHHLLKQVNL